MIRTLLAVFVLCVAVLFAPIWAQAVLFIASVVLVPHRLALFVPAVLADVLYRPQDQMIFQYSFSTIFAAGALIVYWIIITKTRIPAIVHGVEKK